MCRWHKKDCIVCLKIKNESASKSLIVVTINLLIVSIVYSLIFNPKSLNPEVNSLINFILGAVISSYVTIINSYFKNETDKENADKT